MAENSIFLTTINKIDKIASLLTNNSSVLNGSNDCCKEMIGSLSFFLCQILQNNYYTETYLPDQYQNFENFMKLFKRKKDFVAKLGAYLKENKNLFDKFNNIKIKVTIDNVWCIRFENSWKLEIIDQGDYGRLANPSLYFSYEITFEHELIEMYKEIDFESETDNDWGKIILKDIRKYALTMQKALELKL